MTLAPILINLHILLGIFISNACTTIADDHENVVLIGCTPADELIKKQLGISTGSTIDFIRWQILLDSSNTKNFEIRISYGLIQPNTSGFTKDSLSFSCKGFYSLSSFNNNEVYQLKSDKLSEDIFLVKLNENIFHFLTPGKKLMVGNGGWSYSLSKKDPGSLANKLPVLSPNYDPMQDTSSQLVYDGRTPCVEIASIYGLKVSSACFKLKWKLILNRDPISHKPTTYIFHFYGLAYNFFNLAWVMLSLISPIPVLLTAIVV